MSDYGAFAGAQMICARLSADRLMDTLQDNREWNRLVQEHDRVLAVAHQWEHAYKNQLHSYNQLVVKYNAQLDRDRQWAAIVQDMQAAATRATATINQQAATIHNQACVIEDQKVKLEIAALQAKLDWDTLVKLDPETYELL